MENHYIKCECGSELIVVEPDNDDAIIYMSMFEKGIDNNYSMTLREKLRWCWHILTTGKPFTDELVLSYSEAKKLGNYLIKVTENINLENVN